ncbi:MAG: response regulator [Proteobacteria bacterium]|nr:response regulator [Pseudomonadota bacterium]
MLADVVQVESGKVVILDDELVNVTTLKMLLEDAGFSDVVATTFPGEALALCRSAAVDLLILDVNMPQMDGFEVMRQLGEMRLSPPPVVLMLTAQSSVEFRRKALVGGARDYVTKPFDTVELFARVRNLLEMKLLQDRMRNQQYILEEVVKKRTQALLETQESLLRSRLEIVHRLGRAAEYRDNETGNHIIRMSRTCDLLARSIGMPEHECDLLLHASPMHDIGKIGIPDSILLKPGKLTADEWGIMKSHTRIGADILEGTDSELLKMAATIALYHHERWDGSGYPEGLKETEIPLPGRICAAADVFDALLSERPYKKAWSIPEALQYLKAESGRHFDPEIVRHFLLNQNAIVRVYHAYSDVAEAAPHFQSNL